MRTIRAARIPDPGTRPGNYTAPAPQGSRRGPLPWLLAAVAVLCVVALVVGGLVWWQHGRSGSDDETRALFPGQLTGAFPTAPTPAWTLRPSDLGGERFVGPTSSLPTYGSVGVVADDTTVVTLAGGSAASTGRHLVGVDAATGTHWTSQQLFKACADTIVDRRIACIDADHMVFLDTTDGTVLAEQPMPSPQAFSVAYNGTAAFTRVYETYSDSVRLVKITPTGTEWAKEFVIPNRSGSGDGYTFTATDALVAIAHGGSVIVASAVDGREILRRPGSIEIGTLADGSLVTTLGSGGINGTRGPIAVIRPDGTVSEIPGATFGVPQVAAPDLRDTVLVDGKLVSVADRTSSWATGVFTEPVYSARVPVADDRQVVTIGAGGQMIAADTATGVVRWSLPVETSGYADDVAVTDGTRILVGGEGGALTAVDLESGVPQWNIPGAQLGDGQAPLVLAVGGRLVTVTGTAITAFAPTGGDAVAPGAPPAPIEAPAGYVTRCGTPPRFVPDKFVTTPAGLVVTMKVVATCPSGDVLSGNKTRISISDPSGLIASGDFDFSSSPLAVGSSDAGSGITLDLTYPPGSFFRTPDTLGSVGGAAGSTSAGPIVVDCVPGPPTTDTLPAPADGSTAAPQTATGAVIPPGVDVSATTGNALRAQADSDRAFILANLNNRWVAQLSSKRPGLVADGKTWDNQAILDEFLANRLRFGDARLLYSDEWSVFNYRGWWVTVATPTFPGPDQANAWCVQQGFDGDHCFAKLISTTASPDGSTRYR
nr:PQQ-like beta-propeller repeat protein [Gordonia sp. NB41Y]